MAYTVPNFLMGQSVQADFSPIQNALAQYHKNQQFNANKALDEARLGESVRQFDVQNALAQRRFGLDERSAARADQLQPYHIQQIQAQIQHMRQQGASEAQLAPLKIQAAQADIALKQAQAKAEGTKDAFMELIQRNFRDGGAQQPNALAPPQPQSAPQLQPQSFEGSADPLLHQTQAGPSPTPQPQQDLVDIPGIGRMPRERARALGMAAAAAGKGDLGKLIMETVDKDNLAKETRNKIDEQEMNAINGLGRLKQIASGYQDKWLTYENKIKQYGLSWADSFDTMRSKMKPEDVKDLAEYTAWKRDAMENLTQGIKDATGAAMGIQEERRIRAGLPDPEKDSPTQFKAKLLSTMRSYELSIQRTQFLRQNGFRGDANAAAARMPIERFEGVLKDSRGLYQKLKTENPNADDGAIRDEVRKQIRQKYRIDA